MRYIHFNEFPARLDLGKDPETGDTDALVRKALLFVAGDHTDSNSRDHSFPERRVQRMVENTNAWFESGGFIPVLLDHNKSATAVVGSIDAPLETKVITEEDIQNLPNSNRLGHLVGRLGVFCNAVSLKAKEAIDCFQKNWVKTVSPGIDLATDTIRELSLVATPAIAGLSLFSAAQRGIAHFAAVPNSPKPEEQDGGIRHKYEIPRTTALSLADALASRGALEEKRGDYDHLCEMLWQVLENIYEALPETLGETTQEQLLEESIQEFGDQLYMLLEIDVNAAMQHQQYQDSYNGEYAEQYQATRDGQSGYGGYGRTGQYDPNYIKRQQNLDQRSSYSASNNVLTFTDDAGYARKAIFRLHEVMRQL